MPGAAIVRATLLLVGLGLGCGRLSAADDDACHAAQAKRIATCTETCVDRARAAVAPEIRDRVKGYGCRNNCTKQEMFAGNRCP